MRLPEPYRIKVVEPIRLLPRKGKTRSSWIKCPESEDVHRSSDRVQMP